MKTLLPLTLIVLFFSNTSLAKDKIDCTNEEELSRNNIEQCLKQSDTELNKVYKHLINGYKGRAEPQDLLRKAQRAWLVTREAHCTLVGREIAASAGVAIAVCELKMTQHRTEELQALLNIGLDDTTSGLPISENSFRGIEVGDKISSHSGYIKKEILQTGEADFDIYRIKDFDNNPVGYFVADPNNERLVGDITIESETAETSKGIKVGSTFQELMEKLPAIEVHGSEIEGMTHATYKTLSYRLDVQNYTYQLNMKKVPLDTKIIEIIIGRS